MTPRARRTVADTSLTGKSGRGVAFTAVATVVLGVVISLLSMDGGLQGSERPAVLVGLPVTVVLGALAVVIARRVPGNRIAWLLLPIGIWGVVGGIVDARTDRVPETVSWIDHLSIAFSHFSDVVFLAPIFILLVFPTGGFLTPRWRWSLWVLGLLALQAAVGGVFSTEIGPALKDWTIDAPLGFLSPEVSDVLGIVESLGVIALVIGGVTAMVARFRRSSVVVRAQIKWVLYAAVLLGASIVFLVVSEHPLREVAFGAAWAFFPVAITIAITRYRLFDIDRLVSRTVSYAVVVGVLAGVFAGIVALASLALPSDSGVQVAAATLTAAALFNPLLRRVRGLVDRRFNRSAYEVEVVTGKVASRLQGAYAADRISTLWVDAVSPTLQPSHIAVWLRPPET